MPSADDPRFGPGGQYATKPTGTDYAPPPQLDPHEQLVGALQYLAAQKAQSNVQAQQWANVGNTSGRALEPWQTEDRIAYNQAQAQRSQQLQHQAEQQQQERMQQQQFARQWATQAPVSQGGNAPGLISQGNIDLNNRPRVRNEDGSISTVRSITVTDDNGNFILLPTVIGNRVVSNDEAIQHWQQTGESLGTFNNALAAESAAQSIHQDQARMEQARLQGTPQWRAIAGAAQAINRTMDAARTIAAGADQYNADRALNLPNNQTLVPDQGATLDPAQQDQVRRFGRILTPQEEVELGYRTPIHQGVIGALSNPIGYGAGLVSEGINKIPTGGGTNLGQRIESIDNPVLRTGAELGIGIAPYVIAGIATGGVADAALGTAFQGQAAVGAAQSIGTTEQNDWKTIGANLAMLLGPKLAEMGISTTADAIAWVKANPEVIKGLVANPEVRARVAAGEAGSLGKPPAVAGAAERAGMQAVPNTTSEAGSGVLAARSTDELTAAFHQIDAAVESGTMGERRGQARLDIVEQEMRRRASSGDPGAVTFLRDVLGERGAGITPTGEAMRVGGSAAANTNEYTGLPPEQLRALQKSGLLGPIDQRKVADALNTGASAETRTASRAVSSSRYPEPGMNQPLPGQGARFLRDESAAGAGGIKDELVALGMSASDLADPRWTPELLQQQLGMLQRKAAAGAGDAARTSLPADNLPLPPQRSPAFDAEGRPIEMKSGEPYAQFDSHGNPVDPATGQPLNTKTLAQQVAQPLSPVDHAALQINDWLRVGAKARPEQRAMFTASRAQQQAIAEKLYAEGKTSAEVAAAVGGKFPRPFLEPLKLSPEGETALRQEIRDSTIMGYWANKNSAESAIDAMKAGVLPQPDHAVQLSKIVGGPDFLLALDKRAPIEWKKELIGALGIPKSLQSTYDLSAVLRQMAPLGFAHPGEYIDAIGTIGRAARSIESARAVQAETEALSWVTEAPYPEAEALGINFKNLGGRMADIGMHLHESEGQFSSFNQSLATKAVEKLPGVQLAERVYNVPINRQRGLVASKWYENMWQSGERNPDAYKAVAKVIDHASGWSEFNPFQIAQGFSAFYSTRNLAARFQVLLDPILQPGSLFKPSARQLAARNLVGFVSAQASMLGLMAGSGALAAKTLGIPNPVHIGLDPRSPDGFKGRIGNTRVDMTAGFGSIIRLVAQLSPAALSPYTLATEGKWSNPRVTSLGGITRNASAVDLVNNFFANKQDPVFGILYKAMKFPGGEAYAEDFRSKEGLKTAAFHLFTPFFVQDVVEAWRLQGLQGVASAAPVSFLGGGVNTFEQSATSKAADAKQSVLKALEDAGFDSNYIYKQQYGQDALKAQIGGDPSQYDSLSAYRAAYVAEVEKVLEKQGMTSGRAHQTAGERFDAAPIVKEISKANSEYRMNFYKLYPDLAQQAADTGQESFTPNQRKELGIK